MEPATTTAARWPSAGAFEECYLRSYSSLVRLALVTTRSLPAAEEIAQDAFTELWQRRDHVKDPDAWLRRVVAHRSVSWIRRRIIERRAARHRDEPALTVSVAEFLAYLGKLTPRQRAVVFLRYHEDLSDREIARLVGRPPRVVRSLMWRAMEKLRREMSNDDEL